jgi:pimeloyl-ACP methyl ester carboxylesterase
VARQRPTIVFAHANGFPAGTYGVLFGAWRAAGWRVLAPAKFGHDPAFPVSSGWPHLRDELLAFIEREARGGPVALVGHSMGGYLSLLAACRQPNAVTAVVLLDAPIVAGWRAHTFRMLKGSGLIRRAGPGKISARRRMHWPSVQAVREHFEPKRAFALWDRRVFDDYLRHGFEPDPAGGVQLAFHRDVETRIYNTLPHHLQELLRRHPLHCPAAYVGGTRSVENRQLGLSFVRRLAGERWRWIEGTHLFPMEKPDETAAAVLELLS